MHIPSPNPIVRNLFCVSLDQTHKCDVLRYHIAFPMELLNGPSTTLCLFEVNLECNTSHIGCWDKNSGLPSLGPSWIFSSLFVMILESQKFVSVSSHINTFINLIMIVLTYMYMMLLTTTTSFLNSYWLGVPRSCPWSSQANSLLSVSLT